MKVYSIVAKGIRKDFTEAGLKDYLAKGGPGSGRYPAGSDGKNASSPNKYGINAKVKIGDNGLYEYRVVGAKLGQQGFDYQLHGNGPSHGKFVNESKLREYKQETPKEREQRSGAIAAARAARLKDKG